MAIGTIAVWMNRWLSATDNQRDGLSCLSDRSSREAYVGLHEDEHAATVTAFNERAPVVVCSHGITAKRVMTDDAVSDVNSRSLRQLPEDQGIRHLRTEPCRPQTNGTIERFHETIGREWAHGLTYASARSRVRALAYWTTHDNEHRPHSALAGKAPVTRVRSRNLCRRGLRFCPLSTATR